MGVFYSVWLAHGIRVPQDDEHDWGWVESLNKPYITGGDHMSDKNIVHIISPFDSFVEIMDTLSYDHEFGATKVDDYGLYMDQTDMPLYYDLAKRIDVEPDIGLFVVTSVG